MWKTQTAGDSFVKTLVSKQSFVVVIGVRVVLNRDNVLVEFALAKESTHDSFGN